MFKVRQNQRQHLVLSLILSYLGNDTTCTSLVHVVSLPVPFSGPQRWYQHAEDGSGKCTVFCVLQRNLETSNEVLVVT